MLTRLRGVAPTPPFPLYGHYALRRPSLRLSSPPALRLVAGGNGGRRGVPTRVLGIDFGEKRIGLAISDPEGRLAVPLTTLVRHDDRSAMAAIAEIARREGVGRLVLGEPVSLDGTRGPAAARARRFGDRLAARTALPLTFVNEALTSVEAAARLRAAGIDPRRAPERIDAAAAQILLQEDLDRGGAPARGEQAAQDPKTVED
jgi:putative Holliday junction resolvase